MGLSRELSLNAKVLAGVEAFVDTDTFIVVEETASCAVEFEAYLDFAGIDPDGFGGLESVID